MTLAGLRASVAAAMLMLPAACTTPDVPPLKHAASDDCAVYAAVLRQPSPWGDREPPPLVTRYAPTAAPDRSAVVEESYRRLSGLSVEQLDQIAAAEQRAAAQGHAINCDPAALGPGIRVQEQAGQGAAMQISRPARTLDGGFAVVRVNVLEGPLDVIGSQCLMRRQRDGWERLRCDTLWVS